MGTYLYTGKLVKYDDEVKKEITGLERYIIFSNQSYSTGNMEVSVHSVPYIHQNDINTYDYQSKTIRLINNDRSDEVYKIVGDNIGYGEHITVNVHEQVYNANVNWDYKISSLSKYKLDFDTLNRVLTEDDVLKIIDDIDESRCDTDVEDGLTEYGYWVQYFNNMIKEIKDGVIIYRL